MNSQLKTVLIWALAIGVVVIAFGVAKNSGEKQVKLGFGQFQALVDKGEVKTAIVEENAVKGELKNPVEGATHYTVTLPSDLQNYTPDLVKQGVQVEASTSNTSSYLMALFYLLPVVLIIGFWFFFMRQMQQGGNKAMSFAKSKARMSPEGGNKVTFKDVAGIEEVKEELQEIIDFLKDPGRFKKLGGKIPKGALLMGAPGTGKTLLARAIAGEAGVPFFSISGSEFVELFVGVGASRVRDMFETAKKNAPCIIFIDEIDAVGRNRGTGHAGSHEEREQTLNQLLVEMDGFESNEGVIIVAATNRPDVLDQALLRPGRFDRRIVVPRPDLKGREEILAVHVRTISLAPVVDLSLIARGTPGFSGADLANLCNEAALRAARLDKKWVESEDFEFAKDKVLMGSERRSLILSDQERTGVAYHEAGHAIVAYHLPNADPVHKISIVPRGMALGVTQMLPKDDRHNYTREYLEDSMSVLLGGRCAEEIYLGTVTTGAGNDLERVGEVARNMVTVWGMSERLGPVAYRGDRSPFGALWEGASQAQYSEETAREIDEEVKILVLAAKAKAQAILEVHRSPMEGIVKHLLEKEVLDRGDFEALLKGEPLPLHPDPPEPPAPEVDPPVAAPAATAPVLKEELERA